MLENKKSHWLGGSQKGKDGVLMSQDDNSTDVRGSQPITRREDARELTPEEKLSPLDLKVYDQVMDKAKLLPEDDYWVMDAIRETASLGSREFLGIVRYLNEKFPENPVRIPTEKYMGRNISAMQSQPLPKSEVVIGDEENILLAKGARVCVYSKPKAAKTCLSIQLAMDLAAGGIFLGRYKVSRPHNVLYLNFELDEALFEERTLKIKNTLGYEDVPRFRQITLLGNEIPLLDTQEGHAQLREILGKLLSNGFQVEVLILDCRWKTFLKSENESDVMRLWLSNVESLQNDFQFIPVIIHHEGKSTTGMGSGSSNFDRWVNTAIRIKASQNRDEQQQETSAALLSRRQLSVFGNYSGFLEIETVFEYPIHKLANAQVWRDGNRKIDQAANYILNAIREKGSQIDQQELQNLATQSSITEDTFKRALRQLEANQTITRRQDPARSGRHNVVELKEVRVEG